MPAWWLTDRTVDPGGGCLTKDRHTCTIPDRHVWSVITVGTAWTDVISTIVKVSLVPQVTGARQLPHLRQPSDVTQQSNDTENQVTTALHRADQKLCSSMMQAVCEFTLSAQIC